MRQSAAPGRDRRRCAVAPGRSSASETNGGGCTRSGCALSGGARDGIAIESAAPWGPPKAIVAVLYPFVVLGIPIVAYASMQRAATGTGPRTAFALALVLDGLAMGATAPTVRMLVYRSVAVLAVALIVAAGTENDPRPPVGLGVWAVPIVLPLGGLV